MKQLAPTDLAFFDTAPMQVRVSGTVAAPPAAVFAAFADAGGWPRWFPMMHRAAWTRGDGGVGAERTVALRLLGRFEERIIAWTPGVRFAFTMIGSTSPFAAQMAEDYQLAEVAGGTRIDWIMAARPSALGRVGGPALAAISRRLFRGAVPRLARHLRA